MSYGPFSMNKIQLGRETTAGTAVAATSIWRGPATDIVDESEHVNADEDVGILVPTDREYIASQRATLAMPETELTFEQILHILEAGVKTAAPTGTGPYVYTYAFPLSTTLNTIRTYTIETGNAVVGDVNEMEYGFVEEFTLSGEAGASWMMSANWVGRRKSTTTFTGALSLVTVEPALFNKTKLYINDTGGTIGTTQVQGVMVSAEVNVVTGVVALMTGDGNLYFTSHKFVPPEITFSIKMELENNTGVVAAERAKWVAKSFRLVRLNLSGAGTSSINIDIAAKWLNVSEYENSDENTVVTFEGVGRYSSADALFATITVTNSVVSVP